MQRRTKCLTVSALMAALGVVILALGSFLDTIDLSVAALASFFCVYAVIELRGGYPWAIWVVTAGLSFLLLPQKSPALFYLFLGIYPMLKEKIEKLPVAAAWVLKLVWLHASGVLIFLGFRFLFAPSTEIDSRWWYLAVFYVATVFCFILYDVALSRLITFYFARLKGRLGIR